MDNVQQHLLEHVMELQKQVNQLNQQVTVANIQVLAMASRLTVLETENGDLRTRLDAVSNLYKTLRQIAENHNERLEDLEQFSDFVCGRQKKDDEGDDDEGDSGPTLH